MMEGGVTKQDTSQAAHGPDTREIANVVEFMHTADARSVNALMVATNGEIGQGVRD
ncbi:hypothetical protein [Paraburkholderia youngii]|uniref:hypothetical protein n=1 Tax=Paraburkholderia youngii TaxID=2782701 RepID=UPI003D25132A